MKKHILLLLILTLISTSLSAQKQELLDLTDRNLRWVDGEIERINNNLLIDKIEITGRERTTSEINNERIDPNQYTSKDVLDFLTYLAVYQRTENQVNLLEIFPGNKTPKYTKSYLHFLSNHNALKYVPKKVYFTQGEITLTDDLLFEKDTIIDNTKQTHYLYKQAYGDDNHFILDKNKVIKKMDFEVIFYKKIKKEYILNSKQRIAKTSRGIISYDSIIGNRVSINLDERTFDYIKILGKTKQGKIIHETGSLFVFGATQEGINYFSNAKIILQKARTMIANDEISSKDEYVKYVKQNIPDYNSKKMAKTSLIFDFPEPVESIIILVKEEKNIKLNKTFQVHIN